MDYQYAQRAMIYRTLQQADPIFSEWLHAQGYDASGKNFKLFTFGGLRGAFDRTTIEMRFPRGESEFQISFCVEKQLEKFIEGVFRKQTFDIVAGRSKTTFEVQSVEILNEPVFVETMRFRARTGICIAEKREAERHVQYCRPDDAVFSELFFKNLEDKVTTVLGKQPPPQYLGFKLLSDAKKWSTKTPKDGHLINTIGYQFDFELTAPASWLSVGYAAGFGSKNSGGFGFCEVI
jgi:CRISPR-associated endoribonuclease Cas6